MLLHLVWRGEGTVFTQEDALAVEAQAPSVGGLSAPEPRASIIYSTVLPPQGRGSKETWLTRRLHHSIILPYTWSS